MENSLAGSVHRSFDLLVESGLRIVGEVIIPIAHNLIGVPAHDREDRLVESHPVALAQCEQFFIENPRLKRIAAEDTAGSVREVMHAGDPTRAAIASERAAELYGAVILQEHLEDDRENYTRFFLLSPSAERTGERRQISLVFQLAHKPGALLSSARAFRAAQYQHDENREPPGARPAWQYRFYLDLQASPAIRSLWRRWPNSRSKLVELDSRLVRAAQKSAETVSAAKKADEEENDRQHGRCNGRTD